MRCAAARPSCWRGSTMTRSARSPKPAERLRSSVEDSDVPPVIVEAIRAAYKELSGGRRPSRPWRSARARWPRTSRARASQANSQTYLWIEGADSVVENVRRCWSGFFTVEALTYRQQHGLSNQKVLMSVGVQRMVPARSAGVMFTVNPLNGDRSKVVIESTWGLGEPLVSGEVDPDRFTVDKVTLQPLNKVIGAKLIEHRPDPELRRVVVEEVARSGAALPRCPMRRRSNCPAGQDDRAPVRLPAGHRVGGRRRRRPDPRPAGPSGNGLEPRIASRRSRRRAARSSTCWRT